MLRVLCLGLWLATTLAPTVCQAQKPPAHFQKLAHTYNVVARDPPNGDLGVAVQSKFPNIGGLVPWAKANVGAVATLDPARPFATGCGRWYGLFNIPSAQYRNGRTYVVYPNPQQRPVAMYYDHAARKWSKPVLVSTEGLDRDSHGNPAMLVDARGFLHVFWGCHLGPMRYARTEKPEDISTWVAQPPAAPRATYPQAMLTASGRVELFYRGGGHTDDWVLRGSDDGGRTWSAETGILDGVQPSDAWYASSALGPDGSVHLGFVRQDYTEAPLMIRYDIFHVLRDAARVWRSASGERLTLPLSPADANRHCKVYDSRARQEITGGCSVVVDKQGRARLLFRTSGRPKPGTTIAKVPPFHHRFAAWNGKAWDLADVGPHVNSGFEFDEDFLLRALPSGQLRAYVGVNVRGKSQLQEWASDDDSQTWRQARVIFQQPGYALMTPKLVADAHPDAWLVFGQQDRYLFGDSGFVQP
jgi:hypothetical protein